MKYRVTPLNEHIRMNLEGLERPLDPLKDRPRKKESKIVTKKKEIKQDLDQEKKKEESKISTKKRKKQDLDQEKKERKQDLDQESFKIFLFFYKFPPQAPIFSGGHLA